MKPNKVILNRTATNNNNNSKINNDNKIIKIAALISWHLKLIFKKKNSHYTFQLLIKIN